MFRDVVDVRSVSIHRVVVFGRPGHDAAAAHDGWNLGCKRVEGEYRKRASSAADSKRMLARPHLQSEVWLTLTNSRREHGVSMQRRPSLYGGRLRVNTRVHFLCNSYASLISEEDCQRPVRSQRLHMGFFRVGRL
jgi:hypothetical protein